MRTDGHAPGWRIWRSWDSLRQCGQDAQLPVPHAPGIPRALRGGEQRPLSGGTFLLRRVGQGPAFPGTAKQQRASTAPVRTTGSGWACLSGSCQRMAPNGSSCWIWPGHSRKRSQNRATNPFLEIGFPGPHPPYDPVPRYAGIVHAERTAHRARSAGRPGGPAPGFSPYAPAQRRGGSRFGPLTSCSHQPRRAAASGPTTWRCSR